MKKCKHQRADKEFKETFVKDLGAVTIKVFRDKPLSDRQAFELEKALAKLLTKLKIGWEGVHVEHLYRECPLCKKGK